jgi:hypothetical protein
MSASTPTPAAARPRVLLAIPALLFLLATCQTANAQEGGRIVFTDPKGKDDRALTEQDLAVRSQASGINLMIGTDGFGFGVFYHYLISDEWTAFADMCVSQVRDTRQREFYDPYQGTIPINKVNRVLRIPLFAGLQYRLFSEDIVENFRPYLSAGAGPVLLFVAPARNADRSEKEFFTSLGSGHPEYSFGGFVGAGAQFGFDRSSLFGLNIRYFVIPVPAGIQSVDQGDLRDANGFYISLNAGFAF